DVPGPVASTDGGDELVGDVAAGAVPGGGKRLARRGDDEPVDLPGEVVERPGGGVGADGAVPGGLVGGAGVGVVFDPDGVDTGLAGAFAGATGAAVGVQDESHRCGATTWPGMRTAPASPIGSRYQAIHAPPSCCGRVRRVTVASGMRSS